ncbi:MAG: hypothetical protein ACAI44_13600 [Candidatus Sericytochromatia bacterium]
MKHLNYQQGLDLGALDMLEEFQEEIFEEENFHRRHKSRLRRQPELTPRPRRRKAQPRII